MEKRYSLQLPEDFRAYLIYAAPSTVFTDDFGTQWWAPSEIKQFSTHARMVRPVRLIQ